VNLKTLPDVKIYSYAEAQESYCMQEDEEYKVEYWKTHSQCLTFWDNIPSANYMSDLISWCGMKDFPLEEYPDCGLALVYFFMSGKKSPILEREVKKWCEEHKNDECKSLGLGYLS
jgi:hypothetical protein